MKPCTLYSIAITFCLIPISHAQVKSVPSDPAIQTPADWIATKYSQMGGASGPLGPAVTAVTAAADGAYYRHYQSGSIYWTSGAGTREVHGEIWRRYNSLGGPAKLGYPSTDETTPAGNSAVRFNHFNGWSIYWKSTVGAREVHGDIRLKYLSLQGPEGFLGIPLTDESITPDSKGRYNHFEGGSIYFTLQTGAHEVHGAIRDRWSALGWEKSWLGYPVTDESALWNYVDVNKNQSGRFSKFQNGVIYSYPDSGAFEVRDMAEIVQSGQISDGLRKTVGARNLLTILFNPHVKANQANPKDSDTAELTMPSKADVQQALFGSSSSVRGYYLENSMGRLVLNNAGILPADGRAYYEPPSGKQGKHYWDDSKHTTCSNDGWLSGHDERVADAIRMAGNDFDFKKYDTNNDGELTPEELVILIVGPGKDDAGGNVGPVYGGYLINGYCVFNSWTRQRLTVDGVTISNQSQGGRVEWFAPAPAYGNQLQLGLPAHELAHILTGIPDLYFSEDAKSWTYDGTVFSRMSARVSAREITHFDPFLKLKAGWLGYTVGRGSGTYTLRNIENYGEAVILYDPNRGRDEYFILEYRLPGTSYDAGRVNGGGGGLPNSGVAIWHVIENPSLFSRMKPPAEADNWYRKGVLMQRAYANFQDDYALATASVRPGLLYWSDQSQAFTINVLGSVGLNQVTVSVTR